MNNKYTLVYYHNFVLILCPLRKIKPLWNGWLLKFIMNTLTLTIFF